MEIAHDMFIKACLEKLIAYIGKQYDFILSFVIKIS